METCATYTPWHDKSTGKTFLKPSQNKCVHLYFYFIADVARAQQLADDFSVKWLHRKLDELAWKFCPVYPHSEAGQCCHVFRAQTGQPLSGGSSEQLQYTIRRESY